VRLLVVIILAALGCGGATRAGGFSSLRPACPEDRTWNGAACVAWGPGAETLERGEALLSAGEPEQALALFAAARNQGPHRHGTHVRLYEDMGKAHAFLDDDAGAVGAYTTLLALSPGHLLSYHLSAKATFKFEAAREKLAAEPATAIEVKWPDDLDTGRPIPIEVEVVADPMKLLSRAVLYIERGGETRALDLALAPPGSRVAAELPPLGSERPEVLELRLVAFDDRGSEVALWADAERPRRLRVDYTPPLPWYRKWWIWASIGAGVAAAAAGTAYVVTRGPPESVPGEVETGF
jgi:hypothetical protein